MSEATYNNQLSEIYKTVRMVLLSGKREELEGILNRVDQLEDDFLLNYRKRKSEGVYFTDRDITDYIFTQSLMELINSRIEGLDLKSLRDIATLSPESKNEVKSIIFEVKICDPACGSGMFLLSSISILVDLLTEFYSQENTEEIKNQIIKNIHGHDINSFSVDLTRLRLLKRITREKGLDLPSIFNDLETNITRRDVIKNSPLMKFDLIIGNPPYGNILDSSLKQELKKDRIFVDDIYCVFLAKAIEWSIGIIGFLVPKSFLLRQGYINYRTMLLSRIDLLKIMDIGPNLFKKATNEVQIVIYGKKNKYTRDLKVLDYPNKEIITYNNQEFDDLKICTNPDCPLRDASKKVFVYTFTTPCPYCYQNTIKMNRIRIKPHSRILDIINKIEHSGDLNYLNIKKFPKFIRGEEDKGLKEVKKLVKSHAKDSCVYINAKEDLTYYSINKNKSFNIEKVDAKVLKGQNYEFYLNPKLLIKHNNIIPQAVYTEDPICFSSSVYSILHEDQIELKFLSGIINSALVQFYCIYGINNQKDTTINLNQYMIRHLPIIHVKIDVKEAVSEKVDYISGLLKSNDGIFDDTVNHVLREIDALVFQLYSLSDTEIELILSSVREQIPFYGEVYEKDYDFIFDREWTKFKKLPGF